MGRLFTWLLSWVFGKLGAYLVRRRALLDQREAGRVEGATAEVAHSYKAEAARIEQAAPKKASVEDLNEAGSSY